MSAAPEAVTIRPMPPEATALLLHGEETFLIAEAAARQLERWREPLVSDFGDEVLDSASVSAERLRDAILQAPFLDPHRVVAVRGLAPRRSEALAAALAEVPETTRLLISVSGRLAPANRLLKAFAAMPGARVEEKQRLRGRNLNDWVFQQARSLGLPTQVAAMVLRSTPADLGVLDSELRKLAAYAASGGELDTSTVNELLVGGRQEEIFRLTDLILPRPSAEAWPVLDSLLQRDGPTLIAYRVARHLSLVLEVRSHQERGESLSQVQAGLREHPFVVQKAYDSARLTTAERLEQGLRALLEYEWEVKSGQIDAQLGLETVLSRL
jgi:DNA polymerase-3 subunit delta